MKKRFICLFITLVLLFVFFIGAFGQVSAQESNQESSQDSNTRPMFEDVPENAWYREAVERLATMGAIEGREDGKFYPDDAVLVTEFIKMITIAQGYSVRELKEGEGWAQPYIDKAYEKGYLVQGIYYDNDIYNSMNSIAITRQEIASIIVSCLEDEVTIPENDRDYVDAIEDFMHSHQDRHDDILKAYISGIITCRPDKTFGAWDFATRAEAATMVLRLIDKTKRIPGKPIERPEYFLDPVIVVENNSEPWMPHYFYIYIKNYKYFTDEYEFKIDFINYPQLNEREEYWGGYFTIVINQWWSYQHLRNNSGRMYTLYNKGYTTREHEKTLKIEPGTEIQFRITVKRGSEVRTYDRTAIVPDIDFAY
ncbi:MAG TPA: S-layer homology domain-containing protein [Clostridiaceae bacterium]|nr:S-layer homology domain-containing protein [Clostridiaceae bacterium]